VTPEQLEARILVESLRCGVANRRAAAALGTMQAEVDQHFVEQLDRLERGQGREPLCFEASFGEGKSHLLQWLQHRAEQLGVVTSYVVIGPETPLGNAPVVLKEIARQSTAPARAGRALRELATDFRAGSSSAWAQFRDWADDADIDERFRALLHLYGEMHADEEFRVQILEDIQGTPMRKGEITKRLREIGQAAAYDLRAGPRNAALAHDRIRVLARFFRALGCKGLVVLFDEVERVSTFTLRQRLAAYSELGWWRETAEEEGSALLPVFAHTTGFTEDVRKDEPRFSTAQHEMFATTMRGLGAPSGDGLRFLVDGSLRLQPIAEGQIATISYAVRDLYQRAYGVCPGQPPERDMIRTLRAEIRYWITWWDLARSDPEYRPNIEVDEVTLDTAETGDEELAEDENEDSA
jgi:hypothetical protein